MIYLSREGLTDRNGKLITQYGYLRQDLADGILLFPSIVASQSSFRFTYLHPGEYFLTVIADRNGDEYPTPGDLSSASQRIIVRPKTHGQVTVSTVTAQN